MPRGLKSYRRVPKTGIYSVTKGDVVIPVPRVNKLSRVRKMKKIRKIGRGGGRQ